MVTNKRSIIHNCTEKLILTIISLNYSPATTISTNTQHHFCREELYNHFPTSYRYSRTVLNKDAKINFFFKSYKHFQWSLIPRQKFFLEKFLVKCITFLCDNVSNTPASTSILHDRFDWKLVAFPITYL